MWRDDATLLDIATAARLVLEFTRGIGAEEFAADVKTRAAVLYQLLVVGEAAKRLSVEFRAAHGDVPWTQITGMRDRLIHGYNATDVRRVWETVTKDVPELLRRLEPLLPRAEGAG